jgi:outer membrane protein OmpA-like peptidoglycan-associated protein
LTAPWNSDKTTELQAARTTRLTMSMTTLVDRTTGIEGFRTALDAAETGINDRLSRLGASETETEVTIRLPGAVLFDFDSAVIRPDAARILGDVVDVLNAYSDLPVRVEGHTDSIASDSYNLELSERRAASVKAWLAAHGVDPIRLLTVGHGESRPVAENDTSDGRQQNRRVEIVIEK